MESICCCRYNVSFYRLAEGIRYSHGCGLTREKHKDDLRKANYKPSWDIEKISSAINIMMEEREREREAYSLMSVWSNYLYNLLIFSNSSFALVRAVQFEV